MDAGIRDVRLEATETGTSGELGYAVGVYAFTLPTADGGAMSDEGTCLVVFRRGADGSWRAIAEMFNSDKPAL
jgi:ketosteroid isomerase-like protein